MSFTGDLAHLPIVDVIQLLYSTKKTGTLCVTSSKGESQLVFNDGYLVSANHLNNSVRIGQILVEMNSITQGNLEQALQEQRNAGTTRKPLIATLIEQGTIDSEDAYKGLEHLIEMTIVEVLTWTSGTFSLDVEKTEVCDEYRYFPEILKQEILLNVQGILMDALRIYDEKMRDGTLEDIFFSPADSSSSNLATGSDGSQSVTADLLGLDSLDTMKKKIPDVFIGLKDHDPASENRSIVAETLSELPKEHQTELSSFLNKFSSTPAADGKNILPMAVIVFSSDPFMKHAITTVSRHKGHVVFTTDDDSSLDMIIEQSFSRDLMPLLVVDDSGFIGGTYTSQAVMSLVQQKQNLYPLLPVLQLNTSFTDYSFQLNELPERSGAVFPRPSLSLRRETFLTDMTNFLEAFNTYLSRFFVAPEREAARRLNESITRLSTMREPPEVALELLVYMASQFERVLTFVAGASELTAEKGIGITAEKSGGPGAPMLFKIPLVQRSVFQDAIEKKRIYYGLCTDPLLKSNLYPSIGAPRSTKTILLPLVLSGKVIALFYGDFGQRTPSPVQIEQLEIISRFAGLVLEYSFCRKKLDKLTRPI
jgi:hypothetical protein